MGGVGRARRKNSFKASDDEEQWNERFLELQIHYTIANEDLCTGNRSKRALYAWLVSQINDFDYLNEQQQNSLRGLHQYRIQEGAKIGLFGEVD